MWRVLGDEIECEWIGSGEWMGSIVMPFAAGGDAIGLWLV